MPTTVQPINTEYLIKYKMTYLSEKLLNTDIITCLNNYTGSGPTLAWVFNILHIITSHK